MSKKDMQDTQHRPQERTGGTGGTGGTGNTAQRGAESGTSRRPDSGASAGQDRQGGNPGVRTDRAGSDVRSRSADPGQSSYGGFKDQDPGQQHQGDSSRGKGSR